MTNARVLPPTPGMVAATPGTLAAIPGAIHALWPMEKPEALPAFSLTRDIILRALETEAGPTFVASMSTSARAWGGVLGAAGRHLGLGAMPGAMLSSDDCIESKRVERTVPVHPTGVLGRQPPEQCMDAARLVEPAMFATWSTCGRGHARAHELAAGVPLNMRATAQLLSTHMLALPRNMVVRP